MFIKWSKLTESEQQDVYARIRAGECISIDYSLQQHPGVTYGAPQGVDAHDRQKERLLNAESCNYKGDYRSQSETNEAERMGE